MENEPLTVRLAGSVATLTFNRLAKKNAITYAMWLEIAEQLSLIHI